MVSVLDIVSLKGFSGNPSALAFQDRLLSFLKTKTLCYRVWHAVEPWGVPPEEQQIEEGFRLLVGNCLKHISYTVYMDGIRIKSILIQHQTICFLFPLYDTTTIGVKFTCISNGCINCLCLLCRCVWAETQSVSVQHDVCDTAGEKHTVFLHHLCLTVQKKFCKQGDAQKQGLLISPSAKQHDTPHQEFSTQYTFTTSIFLFTLQHICLNSDYSYYITIFF